MNNKGFTLIELLVVIAIIGMLSSVVLVSLNSARTSARDTTRQQDFQQLRNSLELYALQNNGTYPNTSNNWVGSWQGESWIPGLSPSYLSEVPQDPVNAEDRLWLYYYYISNGSSYCLQIPQEKDCSSHAYFGLWESHPGIPDTCMLRIGEYPNC